MKRVIIIGGGVAGLAAAYYAQKFSRASEEGVEVALFEAQPDWGGKIKTERIADFVIEGGPDTFLATKPWAVDLCRELGIADRLHGTNPHVKSTYVLHRDSLHPLPEGLMMMIPTRFGPIMQTRLLSWGAKARMGMDFLIPALPVNGDESLGAFVTRRLGRQAYDNLIEPLMSGIYAGNGDLLSLQATFPQLRELELEYGGLGRGALAVRRKYRSKQTEKPTQNSRSMFLTPETGLAEIVEALIAQLKLWGTDLRCGMMAERVERTESGYCVLFSDRSRHACEGLILAIPPFASGELLRGLDPALSLELDAIPYASTATISLAYRKQDLPRPLDGYGYVIPSRAGRKALACTWTSTKFPHRAPQEFALLRVFAGRAGQEDEISWDESDLLDLAKEEGRATLRITAEPVLSRVFRWEKAMPQYNLGHPQRLKNIDRAVENLLGLALAGNGYRGIGIPDCINSGKIAAQRVLEKISA